MLTAADQVAAPFCQFVARRAVGFVQLLQTIADFVQILNEQHELVIQPPGALGDFAGVLALTLLLPQAVNDAQCRQQCGWADDHDVAVERFLKQRWLGLQGRRKRGFDRHEEQNEIEAVQALQAFVILAGQAFDVIAQGQYVLLDCDLPERVVLGRDVLLIRRETDLGVDHYLFVAWQINDHVWLETLTIRAFEIDLRLVLAALLQTCVFQHAFENQLAPIALGFLAFKGTGQVRGFVTQTQIERLQTLQFLGQRKAFAGLGLVTFFHTFFEGLNAFFQRIEQLTEALLAGFGKALFTLVEDLARQLGELRPQFITRTLQIIEALLMALLLLAQFGVQRSRLRVETAQLGLLVGALKVPGVGGVTGVVTFYLQQLDFAAQGCQFCLLGGVGLAEVGDFIAAGFQLRVEPVLRQLRHGQPLFQQRHLRLPVACPTLQLPGQSQQRQPSACQTKQYAGQVHSHSNSCRSVKA